MEEILYGTDAPTARVETSALLFCVLMQRPGVVSARSEVVVWAGFMDDESARAAYRRHLLKSGFDVRDEDSITVSRIPDSLIEDTGIVSNIKADLVETRTALAVEKGIGREFRNEARELRQEVAELRARLAALNPERPADDHRIMLA